MTTGITVRVDPDKCQGHARCSALAPELFELDEFGYARQALSSCVPPGLVEGLYGASKLSGGGHHYRARGPGLIRDVL